MPDALPLDLLAIGAHPDDVDLLMGGTIALLAKKGRRIGIIDLTRGECGTRGTPDTRRSEAQKAREILGAQERITLDMGDCALENSAANRIQLASALRHLRPSVVVTHLDMNRHPDHVRAHELVRDSCFLANVGGFEAEGERHKIGDLVFFLGFHTSTEQKPDWIVNISETWETKLSALRAFGTQFYTGKSSESGPQTYLASPEFWERIDVEARRWGAFIGARHGEAFAFQSLSHADHAFVRLLQ